jgi:hypothetical protein
VAFQKLNVLLSTPRSEQDPMAGRPSDIRKLRDILKVLVLILAAILFALLPHRTAEGGETTYPWWGGVTAGGLLRRRGASLLVLACLCPTVL